MPAALATVLRPSFLGWRFCAYGADFALGRAWRFCLFLLYCACWADFVLVGSSFCALWVHVALKVKRSFAPLKMLSVVFAPGSLLFREDNKSGMLHVGLLLKWFCDYVFFVYFVVWFLY